MGWEGHSTSSPVVLCLGSALHWEGILVCVCFKFPFPFNSCFLLMTFCSSLPQTLAKQSIQELCLLLGQGRRLFGNHKAASPGNSSFINIISSSSWTSYNAHIALESKIRTTWGLLEKLPLRLDMHS